MVPVIANRRKSWVEVGNIFGETQIFAFLHTLGHNRPFKWIGFVQSGGGIGAFEKAVDDLVFHRTVQAPCTAPLTGVPDHAPVEQARAPVVRAICTRWCATAPTSSVSFAARHSGSNAQQGVPIAWSLLAMKVAIRMSTRNKGGEEKGT